MFQWEKSEWHVWGDGFLTYNNMRHQLQQLRDTVSTIKIYFPSYTVTF